MDALASAIDRLTSRPIQEIHDKIDDMEDKNNVRDKRLDRIETQMDEYQQRDRQNNILIAGLGENVTSKTGITQLLNEKLSCDIKPSDILYTMKLQKKEVQNKRTTPQINS